MRRSSQVISSGGQFTHSPRAADQRKSRPVATGSPLPNDSRPRRGHPVWRFLEEQFSPLAGPGKVALREARAAAGIGPGRQRISTRDSGASGLLPQRTVSPTLTGFFPPTGAPLKARPLLPRRTVSPPLTCCLPVTGAPLRVSPFLP